MDCSENISNLWIWQEEAENSLLDCLRNDFLHYLRDGRNQDDGALEYIFNEQTPIKNCTEYCYHLMDDREDAVKSLEEFRESSRPKRRRMLQYDFDSTDSDTSNVQVSNGIPSKSMEEVLLTDILQDDNKDSENSGVRSATSQENLSSSSQEWLANFCEELMLPFCSDEMVSSEGEIKISDYSNVPAEIEVDETSKLTPSSARIKFKGMRSLKTPTNLVTSVAYPFKLVKPSHVQGDITLDDINQLIHPPPPKSKHADEEEDPSTCYPTSVFSGKPVVSTTKILTEGGKGSITIMRTRG